MRYAAVLILLLSGCISPQEQAARQQEYQRQQAAAYWNNLHATCAAMGFQRGGDPYSQCLLRLHQQNQANAGAAAAAYIGGKASQPLPRCGAFPDALAGYRRARGECR